MFRYFVHLSKDNIFLSRKKILVIGCLPEGQVMTFTEDMFDDIEDPNVERLLNLQTAIEEVRLAIEKGCVNPSKQVLLEE